MEEKQERLNDQFGDEAVYQDHRRLAQLQKELDDHRTELALWYEAWEYRLG